jgi:type VI secretion system (T6SS) effector Hcp
MGAQRKRRKRREDELEEREGRDPAEEAVQEKEEREKEMTPADRVLALQKTAGNRAVGAAVARWGINTLPLAAAPHWPKERQIIADGLMLPLESWSWGSSQQITGSANVGKGDDSGEIVVTIKRGDHSAEWWQRVARGDAFNTVLIVQPSKDGRGITITLGDVMLTNVQSSDELETYSLHFKTRSLSESPPQVQPRP